MNSPQGQKHFFFFFLKMMQTIFPNFSPTHCDHYKQIEWLSKIIAIRATIEGFLHQTERVTVICWEILSRTTNPVDSTSWGFFVTWRHLHNSPTKISCLLLHKRCVYNDNKRNVNLTWQTQYYKVGTKEFLFVLLYTVVQSSSLVNKMGLLLWIVSLIM